LTNISYFRHKGEIHWRFWSPELVRGVGRRGEVVFFIRFAAHHLLVGPSFNLELFLFLFASKTILMISVDGNIYIMLW